MYDFYTNDMTATYNAGYGPGVGELTVQGDPQTFDLDGVSPPDYEIIASANPVDQGYGQYSILNVLVNTSTGVPTSGTLTITGALADDNLDPVTLPNLGDTGTLLNANILSIASAGSGELRLNVNVVSGDVVPKYFPGSQAYVQLHSAGSPATNWYATSWSSAEQGAYSDTYSVPEPCTAGLLLSLAACFAGLAFRRSRKAPV
jgi:hypothetical protein